MISVALNCPICGNLLQQPQETNTGKERLTPQGSSKAQQLVPAGTASTYRIGFRRCLIKGMLEHTADGEEYIGLSALPTHRICHLCKDPPLDGAYLRLERITETRAGGWTGLQLAEMPELLW